MADPAAAPAPARKPAPVSGILRGVVFGPWQPLAEAGARAPATPGVLQARGEALLSLPLGRSAMVLYAASADDEPLAGFVAGAGAALLKRAARHGASYVRFAPSPRPSAELGRLLDRFADRFGAVPIANRADPA